MLIFGTRPEAIKMAPVYLVLSRDDALFDLRVLVTAQHREMLDQVLHEFSIATDYDLDVMRHCHGLSDLTIRILPAIEELIKLENPDLVLVHGDTTTTFLASLAAFYCRVSIGHVEAGLRTGDKYAPFPEEMNRQLTDVLTDWYFAPTEESRENLLRESIPPELIFVTGNTVIDSLLQTIAKNNGNLPEFVQSIPDDQRIILVTTHRRESWGAPLREVYHALRKVAELCPDVDIIFPIHRNPLVRKAAWDVLGGLDRVHLCEPLDYAAFAQMMSRAYLVMTDSGGIQEEAAALGIPVLVLRETTERPEAVRAGTVRIVGTNRDYIVRAAMELLRNAEMYRGMANAVNPYGDGKAAERIVGFLKWKYGFAEKPPEPFAVSNGRVEEQSRV